MSRIGILAGGGRLPIAVAQSILQSGREVHLVGITDEADKAIEQFPHTWSNLGGVGRIVRAFRANDCQELVIVGSTSRPDLTKLRPDFGFVSNLVPLTRMLFGGDDSILSIVVRFFEAKGFIVRGAHELAPDLVAAEGKLGKLSPQTLDEADIARGLSVISALGRLDVGQAVVVDKGEVQAIEGAEGTDRMLERCGRLGQSARTGLHERSGVLIKRPKPGQEIRVDMPAIGPRTVELAAKAQLAGLAVQSGLVLIAERESLIALADEEGLFVSGVLLPPEEQHGPFIGAPKVSSTPLKHLGRRRLGRSNLTDSAKGVRVLRALSQFGTGRAVVVARDYVVAVAAVETPADMLKRCALLRQWGARVSSRRVGVMVCRIEPEDSGHNNGGVLSQDVLAGASAAGLAGIVLVQTVGSFSSVDSRLVDQVERHGLFLATGNMNMKQQALPDHNRQI